MRSGELARLAGVTVRTLRHYHQVGVLAEPGRRRNGYRDYDVHDLIRVLRIRRLASLGIPLERMPPLLDDAPAEGGVDLDELDAELAARIARLTEQRALIARLRDADGAPDLPPELAPFLAVFAAGSSPELARVDRDQSILLAHLAGDEGMPEIVRFYGRIADDALVPVMQSLGERFDRLGPDDTDQDVDGLIDDFISVVAPLLEEFRRETEPVELDGSAALFDEYTSDVYNERQRKVLAQLWERLGE